MLKLWAYGLSQMDMARKLVPRIVAKLAKYLAGPDWCEDVVGHILDEDVGASVAELASGERVDGDAFPSWSCGDSLKSRWWMIYLQRKWLHASVMRYHTAVVATDTAVVAAVIAAVVAAAVAAVVDDDDALVVIIDVERELSVVVELLMPSKGNDEELV